ncbi:MAG: hypothetical protein NC388_03970 [Clostridium sp.]|nr:hypothetical protein [Clostridium sp.]
MGGRIYPKEGQQNFTYSLSNVPVSESAKNTNVDNAVCTLPTMFFTFKSCKRSGNDVELKMTLKNTTERAYSISLNGGSRFYDEDGNTYAPVFSSGQQMSYGNTLTLEPNIPVSVTATIKNVPSSITSLSQARVKFNNDEYYFEVKNQAISAQ